MIIFKKASQLSQYLLQQRNSGLKTGFVPTMGALHDGHLSLIDVCRKQNDLTICSIFINPTQFNNPEDFKHYPVTLEKDLDQLIQAGCDVLFLPSVEEIYQPDHFKKHYDLGELEHILEGHYRPGHFQGVCEVVDRLLNIILPHRIYLGQKDYQQCMVIKKLIGILGMQDQIEIHIQPTRREPDGLAMSSRNLRLSPGQRSQAPALFKALFWSSGRVSILLCRLLPGLTFSFFIVIGKKCKKQHAPNQYDNCLNRPKQPSQGIANSFRLQVVPAH